MDKLKTLEVCKICFNASSQKANPTLTTENKALIESAGGPGGGVKKRCPNCRQSWSSQKVGFDPDTNRWVVIRPRPQKMPHLTDYTMCSNIQKKQLCGKGPGLCTFAHSQIELAMWNHERWKEPRPTPQTAGGGVHQLCKYVMTTGACTFGQRCTFAHSEGELQHWKATTESSPQYYQPPSSFNAYQPPSVLSEKLYCNQCNIWCTGKKQYDEHIKGSKHRSFTAPLQQQFPPPPPHPVYYGSSTMEPVNLTMDNNMAGGGERVRACPLRLPVGEFRMCMGILTKKRCYYGDRCTFAHNQTELEAWNQERQRLRRSRFAAGPVTQFNPYPIQQQSSSGLDDFDDGGGGEGGAAHKSVDFAQKVRTTVMLDFQDLARGGEANKELVGLERTVQNVTISLSGNQSDTQTVLGETGTTLSWNFEITTTSQTALHSVVMFDVLDTGFVFRNVELVSSIHVHQLIPLQSKASQGEGILINQSLNPHEKIIVKVDLVRTRIGVMGQTVLFDFGSFYMIRCLTVHVASEQEKQWNSSSTATAGKYKPEKVDLFWEQHYRIKKWPEDSSRELADTELRDYELPEQVEKLIEGGKYKNVEQRIKKDSYVRRMHNLLYLEEYQERKDISRYDLYDVRVDIKDRLEMVGVWINDPNCSFITVEMEVVLFEGSCSVRPNDYCYILPNNQDEVHESLVYLVQRDAIIIKITKAAKEACLLSNYQCSMRFSPTRTRMKAMHQAVDTMDLDVLFPDSHSGLPDAVIDQRILKELERSTLNDEQKKALRSMVDPRYTGIPTLVLGPFGCGKTRTMQECISVLSRYIPEVHILICTHTNSAADIYVESIHSDWLNHVNIRPKMCRIYFKERDIKTITPTVRSYCNISEGSFYDVPCDQLMNYSIIVTTTVTARILFLSGLRKGFFTHIFIDEAAQVYEPEVLIPLCLSDKNTKVVLAGDTMQVDPPVYSQIAKRYGLNVSLLERLFDLEYYLTGLGGDCRISLTQNHRSHEQILSLPSKLFYNNRLTCRAQFQPDGPKRVPPLQFIGVDGRERQDVDSPSFYNDEEASKIVEEVETLCRGSQIPSQCLPQEDICVLSFFYLQVKRIRSKLRERKLGNVQVYNITNVQGKEFRALLISTVRTSHTHEDTDEGFLNNIKLFNTAITRAREWLIIVGEPVTLCTVGYNAQCWLELIKKCIETNTFRYPRSELFLNFLETKKVARHILHQHHKEFITKANTAQGALSNHSIGSDIRPLAQQFNALSISQQQQHLQQQKLYLVRARVQNLMTTQDQDIAIKITDDILKREPNFMIVGDDAAAKSVRDREGAYKRLALGQIAVPSNPPPLQQQQQTQSNPNSQSNLANMMGDLPPFLKNQVDNLTWHLRFCETQRTNPSLPSEVVANLNEQRTVLLQQMTLLNEQIRKYRDYLKLTKHQHMIIGGTNHQIPPELSQGLPPQLSQVQPQPFPSLPTSLLSHPPLPSLQQFSQQPLLPTIGAQPTPMSFHNYSYHQASQPLMGAYGGGRGNVMSQQMTNPIRMSNVGVPGLMGHYQSVGGSGGASHVMNANNPAQGGVRIVRPAQPQQMVNSQPPLGPSHPAPLPPQTNQLISPINDLPKQHQSTWDSDEDFD
ncbi:PREDICTED: probable helicase with zinc finger domain [Amphimedon queenslandica]|uniref:C3H1-type domain-containing protein n=1 Tax=Amphimedon queenslandica TaxID=400682 RepID=A0AAN0IQM0_AMPQE|nr:PREDICTED: probable helicase with zinc finger domain [Amphimedon queenslandica]|eukprot:XP_011406766.2 PREDICTED: probable helicase with zinc finger domain [Amphimedon queenslandica]